MCFYDLQSDESINYHSLICTQAQHMNLASYQSLPPLQDTTLSKVPEETQAL